MNQEHEVQPAPSVNRARWSAALALLLLVPAPSIGTWMALYASPGPSGQFIYFVCKAWLLIFPVAWFFLIERRRPTFTLPARRGIVPALTLGAVIAAAILLAYFFVARSWVDPEPMRLKLKEAGLAGPPIYWGFAAYVIVINSLLEEYVWRWFVFRQCERVVPMMRGWIAILLSALLFTIHHIVALRAYVGWNVTALASAGLIIGGATWSWLYLRYRSIIPCWICHSLADIAVYVVGYLILFK